MSMEKTPPRITGPEDSVLKDQHSEENIIDLNYNPDTGGYDEHGARKKIEFQPASERLQGPRPVWKVSTEPQPRDEEGQELIGERKEWLGKIFSAVKDSPDGEISKTQLIQEIRGRLQKPVAPGMPTMLDKRLANDETAEEAKKFLDRFEQENVSLRDLFQDAQTFSELRGLKVLSAALLENSMTPQGQRPWEEMNEEQKRMTRLGELLGLEVERRQIHFSMRNNRRMEQGVVQRAYDRYINILGSADVPDLFRSRFEKTAENLQEGYGLEKREPVIAMAPERMPRGSEAPAAGESIFLDQAGVIFHAQQEIERAVDITPSFLRERLDMMRAAKQELTSTIPSIRALEQALHDDRFSYPPSFVEQLKETYRSADVKTDVYRQRFMDSLEEQMRYTQYGNNNPGRIDWLARGWIDGIGARYKVFGLRGIFRPFKTGRELQNIRKEAMHSFLALQGSQVDKNFIAYHVAELGLGPATQALKSKLNRFQESNAAIAGYYKNEANLGQQAEQITTPLSSPAEEADRAIDAYYSRGAAATPEVASATSANRREELEAYLVEQGIKNAQRHEEFKARRREELRLKREERSRQLDQELAFRGLETGVRTWLMNNPTNRDLLRWKRNNLALQPVFERYVTYLNKTEAEVWADMIAQHDEKSRGNRAA